MLSRYIASPLNYIGGKYKLLPQILPLFPAKIETFVDLFCGGCNVGINVKAERVCFNDNLSYLIDLYRAMQSISEDEIVCHIEERIATFDLSLTNDEGYKSLRELYNTERNPLDLFVLTAYSFNHQIRFNNSHQFNNPFGRERSCFNPRMRSNLLEFIRELKGRSAQFTNFNFDEFDTSQFSERDFIYCDPPYLITTGTYNDGKRGFTGWSEEQELELLSILDRLDGCGVRFALSNVIRHRGVSNTILEEWIAKRNYTINYIDKNYANSNYQAKDKCGRDTVEVLITNYAPENKQTQLQFI